MSTQHTTGTTPVSASHKFAGFNVPPLLSWRNPHATGIAAARAVGLWVVLSSTLTLRLFLRLAAWSLVLLSGVEFLTRQLNGGKPPGLISQYRPSRFFATTDTAINHASSCIASTLRRGVYGIEHLVDARDPYTGLKAAGISWVFYVLLGLFSLRFLTFLIIVTTFGAPPLYLHFKTQVDALIGRVLGHVHQRANAVHKKVDARFGPQLNFAKSLLGTRGGFPSNTGSSVPTRDGFGPSASRGFTASSSPGSDLGSGGLHSRSVPSDSLHTTSSTGASGSHSPGSGLHSTSTTTGASGLGNTTTGLDSSLHSSLHGNNTTTSPSLSSPYTTGVPTGLHGTTASGHSSTDKDTTSSLHRSSIGSGLGSTGTTGSSKLTDDDVANAASILNKYDEVPTLIGNVKVDKDLLSKFPNDASDLRSSIAKDKKGL